MRVLAVFLLACLQAQALRFAAFGRSRAAHGIERTDVAKGPLRASTDLVSSTTTAGVEKLTQKEYLIAVRNRLFAVEEQIWLHEYAVAHPGNEKVVPFSETKYDALLRARGDLMDEYPCVRLYTDLRDAQQRNMTYAAGYLERLIRNFERQMPVPMIHVNQIVVLSHQAQVINLMRGQGLVYHRLLPASPTPTVLEGRIKRQFQHPCFSQNGGKLAVADMQFRDNNEVVRADVLVYDVPNDPKTFGNSDSMPAFASGELPGAPFFIRFSPDGNSVAMLCSVKEGGQATALVLLNWAQFQSRDGLGSRVAASRFNPRKAVTALKGSPVYFSYTTSNPANATIVAHCYQEVADPVTKSMVSERAVWLLDSRDASGVADHAWKQVSTSTSDKENSWSTPICHSAGGGDSVLVVEDGWLVSKTISRWKRGPDGQPRSKKLLEIVGKAQAQFLAAPDNSKVVVLQEDINTGHYRLTVIEGEKALDPCDSFQGTPYELPCPKVTVAFWFSPDSTKVLLLTSATKTVEEVPLLKGQARLALNSEMQWSVFNFPLGEMREYEVFKPTLYFMKTNIPFFSQYAQTFNPWAPDSRSFIYATNSGLMHSPLVGSRHCLGEDKWQNQGASYGTWSRH